jgi:hypothetical protein
MAAVTDVAYGVVRELVGPDAWVPWWAWFAVLAMIFWGLLIPDEQDS